MNWQELGLQEMYESMKMRVERVVERGSVSDDDVTDDQSREPFSKWTKDFTRNHHPAVIQVSPFFF